MRPDILLEATAQSSQPVDANCCVTKIRMMIEVGYCREGFGKAKMEEKQSQHEFLRFLTSEALSTTHTLQYITATLGVSGATCRDIDLCLARLGVSSYEKKLKMTHLVKAALD